MRAVARHRRCKLIARALLPRGTAAYALYARVELGCAPHWCAQRERGSSAHQRGAQGLSGGRSAWSSESPSCHGAGPRPLRLRATPVERPAVCQALVLAATVLLVSVFRNSIHGRSCSTIALAMLSNW